MAEYAELLRKLSGGPRHTAYSRPSSAVLLYYGASCTAGMKCLYLTFETPLDGQAGFIEVTVAHYVAASAALDPVILRANLEDHRGSVYCRFVPSTMRPKVLTFIRDCGKPRSLVHDMKHIYGGTAYR